MNLETALVHKLCPICCAKTDEQIVLNQKLTKEAAEQVKEMHSKAIGFSEPCSECQTQIDNDFIAVIGINPNKSNPEKGYVKLENIYRTGQLLWIKHHIAKSIFNWNRPEPFIFVENEIIYLLTQKVEADNE